MSRSIGDTWLVVTMVGHGWEGAADEGDGYGDGVRGWRAGERYAGVQECGVSRKTFYKYVQRCRDEGVGGFEPPPIANPGRAEMGGLPFGRGVGAVARAGALIELR
jgi:hypothetical protein